MAKHRRKPWLASVLLFYPGSMIYLQRGAFACPHYGTSAVQNVPPPCPLLAYHFTTMRRVFNIHIVSGGRAFPVLRCELCHAAWAEEQLFHAHFLRMVFMPNIIPYCMNKDQCLELLVMRFLQKCRLCTNGWSNHFFRIHPVFSSEPNENQRPG